MGMINSGEFHVVIEKIKNTSKMAATLNNKLGINKNNIVDKIGLK